MDIKTLLIDTTELSEDSINMLHQANIHIVGDLLKCTKESLSEMKSLDEKSVDDILKNIEEYKKIDGLGGIPDTEKTDALRDDFEAWMKEENGKLAITEYLKENAIRIKELKLLSARSYNRLSLAGYEYLYQIAFLPEEKLTEIPDIDGEAAGEIKKVTGGFLSQIRDSIVVTFFDEPDSDASDENIDKIHECPVKNDKKIMENIHGNKENIWDDESIKRKILDLYLEIGFEGLNCNEIVERLDPPENVTNEQLKAVIGQLLAAGELEYVDYRCYRVYKKFADFFETCADIDERSKDIIRRRLQGVTLREIAEDAEDKISKQRVSQIIKNSVERVRKQYTDSTGLTLFDEDYYRYLYETYEVKKTGVAEWLGISEYVWNYFELNNIKQGKKELQEALKDNKGIDLGMRLRIENYLNRNKVYIDGMLVEKNRADLERVLVKKFCTSDRSYNDFFALYNKYLEQEEIPYDEKIYYTDKVYRSRKNEFSKARYVLWKQNEQMRYYDIDSRDYTELLETLNLNSYENIEISTLKLIRDYPELMEKYDIRDQYELHNLLRKILKEEDYPGLQFGKMPEIKFGSFDRDAAILEILIEHSPIHTDDLAQLISEEYGYETFLIKREYLKPFFEYCHKGIYSVDQKQMLPENKRILQSALTDDFYYIDEVKRIYKELIPDADVEEINAYNFKTMGFLVLSGYVIQNYDSVDAFFEHLLTGKDIINIAEYKKRFARVQAFAQKLTEMKQKLQIIEFQPDQFILYSKLEQAGVTRKVIGDFCDEVFNLFSDGEYFTIETLKVKKIFESGAAHTLYYDTGFQNERFYINLLMSDERFSFGSIFGKKVLVKGKKNVTVKSFVINQICKYAYEREEKRISTYDLVNTLTETFGFKIGNWADIIYKIKGSEIYYDKDTDNLYLNKEIYYKEIEEGAGWL